MTSFFLTYLQLLFTACVAICGWHLSTRHVAFEMPDGTVEYGGNIFKGWSLFWQQKIGSKLYWYNESNMRLFMFHVKPYLNGAKAMDGTEFVFRLHNQRVGQSIPVIASDNIISRRDFIEKEMGVSLHIEKMANESYRGLVYVWVAKEEPEYRFPEWVRKMLSSCITCHASLYGMIPFVLFHLIAGKAVLDETYNWVSPDVPFLLVVFLSWIYYTLSLSFLLTWMYKKI